MTAPTATVIVVCRDRWSLVPDTLDLLLGSTDARHPVVVVAGRTPPAMTARLDRIADTGRISVVHRDRHLAGNEARNLGLERAETDWVAFVENDTVMSNGWLETLLEAGDQHDAASVYPAYLVPSPDGPLVHGLGRDLEVGGPPGRGYARELPSDTGRPWRDVAPGLVPVSRVQGEPHALVIRREALDRMGGLDEALLSWFDHIDLALRHRQHGFESWFIPSVTCTYLKPPPVALYDIPGFLLRWSHDWLERSLERLCSVWGLDPHDRQWEFHSRYRTSVRRNAMTRWRYVNAVLDRSTLPAERLIDRWNDRAPAR